MILSHDEYRRALAWRELLAIPQGLPAGMVPSAELRSLATIVADLDRQIQTYETLIRLEGAVNPPGVVLGGVGVVVMRLQQGGEKENDAADSAHVEAGGPGSDNAGA
jgi:hypothetical protein